MLNAGGRRVLFAGGKGGVGKSTVAAAMALRLADRERVLLVSTDPAHSLGDLFGRPVGGDARRLRERLWAVEVDPEAETDRYLRDVERTMRTFVRPALYDQIRRQMRLTRSSPGAREAALLDRITEILTAEADDYDRLVFDTAPTGHTLRLLSLPETMTAWMDGLLEGRRRSESFGRIAGGPARPGEHDREDDWEDGRADGRDDREGDGGGDAGQRDGPALRRPAAGGSERRAERIREILDRRRRKFRRARRLLTDPERCGFLVVVNPDALSIREGLDMQERLGELEMPLLAVVVNRVLPEEAEGEFLARRRAGQARHLERVDRLFADVDRVRVPLLPADVHGEEGLREVARHLEEGRGA